ncbi:MAG: tyrosine-type recombinase/integrase [Caldilineaceae bacterium]
MRITTVLEGYWLDKRLKFSPRTVANYTHFFNRFIKFLGDVEFEAITSNDVRKFLHYLGESGLSQRSVHDYLIPLSSLWTWANKELGTPHIIRGKIAEPDYTEKVIEPFTADELRQLVEASEFIEYQVKGKFIKRDRPNGEMLKAMLLTFVDTGLRVSELCALTVGDYDAKRGRLHVKAGKGNKSRFVVMGSRTRKTIWKYLTSRPGAKSKEPLFATKTGSHLDRNNVRHMLDAIAKQANVNDVYPHRFRHTFAINFLRNGGNVLLLKELLGHESLEMVTIYVHLAEQDIDQGQAHSPVDNWRI